MVLTQPVGNRGERRDADRLALAFRMRAGIVGVEVLVQFVDIVVAPIVDAEHHRGVGRAVTFLEPALTAGVTVTRHEDEILGADGSDLRDCGVGGFQPGFGRQTLGFVHQTEADFLLLLEFAGEALPQIGEGGDRHLRRADRCAAIGGIIVHIEDDEELPGGRPMNDIGETAELARIELAVQGRLDPLPAERNANDVHACGGEMIDRRRLRIEIIAVGHARQLLTVEFRSGNIHAGQKTVVRLRTRESGAADRRHGNREHDDGTCCSHSVLPSFRACGKSMTSRKHETSSRDRM